MEHRDARDNFDRSPDPAAGDTSANNAHEGGFSTATGAGTSMGAQPTSPLASGGESRETGDASETGAAGDEPAEQGTDPQVVENRDEPDLPVRTATDQPETAGGLPHGSDIEQRLAAAARAPHHDAGEPDAALGR